MAVVTGAFGLSGILVASFLQVRTLRQENTTQHGESLSTLARLDERSEITLNRVEHVSARLDDHIDGHSDD